MKASPHNHNNQQLNNAKLAMLSTEQNLPNSNGPSSMSNN